MSDEARQLAISADMGEGSPYEEAIWPLIDAANVACGGHAGDEASMQHAAERARELGVRIGAHPSYPDRENFGRASMTMDEPALVQSLVAQILALRSIAPITFVKAHGALYNDAHRDAARARALVDAICRVDPSLSIVCPAISEMARAAVDRSVHVIREAFADRRYESDGSLVSRKLPDALLGVDEAAEQARRLVAEGVVVARDGSTVPIAFDTICAHADMDGALERLQAIRAAVGTR